MARRRLARRRPGRHPRRSGGPGSRAPGPRAPARARSRERRSRCPGRGRERRRPLGRRRCRRPRCRSHPAPTAGWGPTSRRPPAFVGSMFGSLDIISRGAAPLLHGRTSTARRPRARHSRSLARGAGVSRGGRGPDVARPRPPALGTGPRLVSRQLRPVAERRGDRLGAAGAATREQAARGDGAAGVPGALGRRPRPARRAGGDCRSGR